MLHRAKYSRFRNDSVSSLEDGAPTAAVALATAAKTPPSPTAPAPGPRPDRGASEEATSTLCTFIPRMANIRISTSAALLGLKGLALAPRDPPKGKLSGGCRPADPRQPLSGYLPPRAHLDDKMAARSGEVSRTSSLKPVAVGTEGPALDILESGMTYHIKVGVALFSCALGLREV